MKNSQPDYTIYTDGGCIGNPGPGGFGVVIHANRRSVNLEHPELSKPARSVKERREISGGYRLTTNNRMELMAAIAALQETSPDSVILLFSDSRYLIDGMTKGWAETWRANRWRKADKRKALNVDLWKILLTQTDVRQVSFTWVAGHTGNKENERCHKLSVQAASRRYLPPDTGYESENTRQGNLI